MRPQYLAPLQNRILEMKDGQVFVPSDFADLADMPNIKMSLKRLTDDAVIRRIIRGIYDRPQYSQLLQEFAAPDLDGVARAIARNHGWSIVPCGDTALNLLGLSTQVPAVYLYISDGPYRTYTVENQTIQFKHSTQKNVTGLSPTSALVVQAIKALGEENVDKAIILKLQDSLTAQSKAQLRTETKQSTTWIYRIIKEICQEEAAP